MRVKVNTITDKEAGNYTSSLADTISEAVVSLDTTALTSGWQGQAKEEFFHQYNTLVDEMSESCIRLRTVGERINQYIDEIVTIDSSVLQQHSVFLNAIDSISEFQDTCGNYFGLTVGAVEHVDMFSTMITSGHKGQYVIFDYYDFVDDWEAYGITKGHYLKSTFKNKWTGEVVENIKTFPTKQGLVDFGKMVLEKGEDFFEPKKNINDIVKNFDNMNAIGKVSKVLEVAGIVGDVVELGLEGYHSVTRNIEEGAGGEEIVAELGVDVAFKVIGMGTGAAIGGAVGSLIPVPVVGTLVGAAVGIGVEMGVEALMEIDINGKSVREYFHEGATRIAESIVDVGTDVCESVGQCVQGAGEMALEAVECFSNFMFGFCGG